MVAPNEKARRRILGQIQAKLAAHPGSRTAQRAANRGGFQPLDIDAQKKMRFPTGPSPEECTGDILTEYNGETVYPDEEGCLSEEDALLEEGWGMALYAETAADFDELEDICMEEDPNLCTWETSPQPASFSGGQLHVGVTPLELEDGSPCASDVEALAGPPVLRDFEECMNRSEDALYELGAVYIGGKAWEWAFANRTVMKISFRGMKLMRAGLILSAFHAGYKLGSALNCWADEMSPLDSALAKHE